MSATALLIPTRQNRCGVCFHDECYCICGHLKPLHFSLDVRFVVYLHVLEYGNAGDAAKLLSNAAPTLTGLYIHGVEAHEV